MNKLVKDALILTVITLVAGVALGLVYEVTKDPIAIANENARQAAFKALFAEASFEDYADFDADAAKACADAVVPDEVPSNGYSSGDVDFNECVVAYDSSGTEIGKVFSVTSHKSYGGDVTVVVGINADGNLAGYSITQISDTPGLGMKAKEDKFSSQFKDIAADFLTVVKSGKGDGQIEAISGATITSKAVTNAVDCAIAYSKSIEGGQ